MLKPTSILGDDAMNLNAVGGCYSIDQAWVEGALCTAESVLNPRTAFASRSVGDTEPSGT